MKGLKTDHLKHFNPEDIESCNNHMMAGMVVGCKDMDICPDVCKGYTEDSCEYLDDQLRRKRIEAMAEKYVRSMVEHGHMHGFNGDVSEKFIKSQINLILSNPKISRCRLAGAITNLVQYCGWKREEVDELANIFNFIITEDPGLIAGVRGEIRS